MLKRWRAPAMFGAAAITTCFIVELIAIVVGATAAGTVAAVLDPLGGILLAIAIGIVVFGFIRRSRRKGNRCSTAGCASEKGP